ncbi:MAG TPA: hypothetical protein VFE57_05220 [Cyclobacteriaceae bacterium]|jgi:hypothetical protein|nr:hypothetical protein [Cyclobacteriaceae bacterium]
MIKYLLISLLIGFQGLQRADRPEACDNLKLSVQVSSTQNGLASSTVTVTGGVAPISYIFFYPDGKLVDRNRNVSLNKIERLQKGKYVCAVADNAGCSKKIEFEIE